MKFVMIEKVVSGYQKVLDARCYKNEFGEFHKDKGPAIIDPDGVLSWYNDGKFIKSVNIEDDDTQIDNILTSFNFDRVHCAMRAIDWTYMIGDEMRVPEIVELRQYAKELLNDCKQYRNYDEYKSVFIGGFEASACKQGFTLRFVLDVFSTQ